MRTKMMGRAVTSLAVAALLAAPSAVQSQQSPGAQRASELEAEAAELHDQPDRWVDAANLYLAAAQLRQHEDPQAQKDLFLAANLSYQTGHTAGAIAAMESAGSRARSSGNAVDAAVMFARAAWIAQEAGLRRDERRLKDRVVELANAADLTRAERSAILARISGE